MVYSKKRPRSVFYQNFFQHPSSSCVHELNIIHLSIFHILYINYYDHIFFFSVVLFFYLIEKTF